MFAMIKGVKEDRKHDEKTEMFGKERFLKYSNSFLEMRIIITKINSLNKLMEKLVKYMINLEKYPKYRYKIF